ncbi:MAG: nucleotidyltransferase domain-containing protein [Actinomycetes bacterium]
MTETANSIPVADLIAESVRRLRASLQAERIYLFGSRARDEAHEGSDYDFLVVVRDSPLPRYKREQQAFRALCGMGIAEDVLVFTREEFERGPAVATSLPSTVARDGRLLYP